MHKVDYWVEVEGDDTTGEQVYNVRSALAKAKKMAKQYNKDAWVTKFVYDEDIDDMVPADFSFPSYWVVKPSGEIKEH